MILFIIIFWMFPIEFGPLNVGMILFGGEGAPK